MQRLFDPEQADSVDPSEYSFRLSIKLETGDERYASVVNSGMWVGSGMRRGSEGECAWFLEKLVYMTDWLIGGDSYLRCISCAVMSSVPVVYTSVCTNVCISVFGFQGRHSNCSVYPESGRRRAIV
jgi:hypothetical protein